MGVATLTVISGTEGGRVTSTPSGIDCGSTCVAHYEVGAWVSLKAVANPGWKFTGWRGAEIYCKGTEPCGFGMMGDRTVQANFERQRQTLSVKKSNAAAARIISNPPGIDCGSACSAAFDANTDVYIKVETSPGWVFSYWTYGSGISCSGTGISCKVTMSSDRTIQANFRALCPGAIVGDPTLPPDITIWTPDYSNISGVANNIDATNARVVLWALTDKWYVQPYIAQPFTTICGDGSWSNYTHPWRRIVALLVDSTIYNPGSTRIYHPSNDPGVLAWAQVPAPRGPVAFSGHSWDIKVAEAPFAPGPNYFSDDPENVFVDSDGRLHLKIVQRNGHWYCSEVLLRGSLGYGEYTVQLDSPISALGRNTVLAPLFTYESPTRELDFEFAGDGLIPGDVNGQFVVQPWDAAGHLRRFVVGPATQTSHRLLWRPDRIEFTSWVGHGAYPPAPGDVIDTWTYTGSDIPPAGAERVHMNAWLFGGAAPVPYNGDELIVRSFAFQPL